MRAFRTGVIGVLGTTFFLGLFAIPAAAETRIIRLNGFDEVPVVITGATGELRVDIAANEQTIEYTLSYENIEGGSIRQAHIHLGQQHTTGAIVVFLCTNLGNAPPSTTNPTPGCPASPGVVSGALDASNVIAKADQGVGPGDLAAVIEAIRSGVAYGNVHTDVSPSGEIRANFPGSH